MNKNDAPAARAPAPREPDARGRRITVFTFYATCVLSGAIELGGIFWALGQGYGVVYAVGMTVAYQLGNIFLFLITRRIRKLQSLFVCVALILGRAVALLPGGSAVAYALCFVEVVLLSTLLQTMRSAVKGSEPRWRKRVFRVVGFAVSGVFFFAGNALMAAVPALLLALSVVTPRFDDGCWAARLIRGEYGDNRLCVAMVLHQMHYFVYCYAMLIIAFLGTGSPLAAGLWFVGNWVPYIATEPLAKATKSSNWMVFFLGGHILVSTVLLGMYAVLSHSLTAALILWVLTGFGGGNVFCIKQLFECKRSYHSQIWVLSENIGHLLGVAALAGIALAGISLDITLLIAAALALSTVVVTYYSLHRAE
ncbi:MAG TPA: hypothetical protein IAD14_09505 [Candidatus Coprousia avicola]|nr:hypothetical protein [Candidatus Coprousia avicola]